MTTELIYNIYKYFAKFPKLNSVLVNFDRADPEYTRYDTLKTEIENLAEDSLIPELENYIFGNDEASISKRLRGIDGKFLFIEYSDISSNLFTNATTKNLFRLRIIVAENSNNTNRDEIELMIANQENLYIIQQIVKKMLIDKDDYCNSINFPENDFRIIPVEPTAFYENLGWMLEIQWMDNNLFI